MKKGWYWPFFLVGLQASGVGANLYFMSRAISDPSFAVEPDYYAKAIAWDAHQAQARDNAELGWELKLDVAAADPGTGRARRRVARRSRRRSGAGSDGGARGVPQRAGVSGGQGVAR